MGLFPGLGDGSLLNDNALPDGFSRGTFELVVFIPLIITLAIGVYFYFAGRATRAHHRLGEPCRTFGTGLTHFRRDFA